MNESNLKAAINDQLYCLQSCFAGWMNVTDAVSTVQQSYDDAATHFRIPYRVDGHTPSDALSSLTGSAWVASRANGDATPGRPGGAPPGAGDTRDSIIGASTLLSALGIRPMMDVMWTTARQVGDPYNCNSPMECAGMNDVTNLSIWSVRQNIQRDLLVATMSAGPVGIGDAAGMTDLEALRPVLSAASVILKPAHPFLRLNRYYLGKPDSIFTAVSVPARSPSAAVDRRANSMSRIQPLAGVQESTGAVWWHMLLTTQNPAGPDLEPVGVSELWPTPAPTAAFLATWAFGWPGTPLAAGCVDGAKPGACLMLVDDDHPLNVSTPQPIANFDNTLAFRHLVLAPVLADGWVLVGELSKFVPVSPQRFLVYDNSSSVSSVGNDTASDACLPKEITVGGRGLAFRLLGSPGEKVSVVVVAPAQTELGDAAERAAVRAIQGTVLVLRVVIGQASVAEVVCGKDGGAHCSFPDGE